MIAHEFRIQIKTKNPAPNCTQTSMYRNYCSTLNLSSNGIKIYNYGGIRHKKGDGKPPPFCNQSKKLYYFTATLRTAFAVFTT